MTDPKHLIKPLAVVALGLLLASCRGKPFKEQPVHPNMNMDQQKRMEAQEVNPFFADNRSMRQPVDGTVARGQLKADTKYYYGRNEDSSFVQKIPATIDVNMSFMKRGQDRFNVYCTPCHGEQGNGKGIVMVGQYGYVPAPSYHNDRIRQMPDGQIYDVILNGVRTMPSYAQQIPVRDRWAIVAYIRALQESQNATAQEAENMGADMASLKKKYQQQQEAEAQKQQAQQQSGGGEVSADKGKQLFSQMGCASCHSTDGSKGVGPTFKGLFGHEVTLQDGSTVTADEDYIHESIMSPNAKTVQGFQPVMPNMSSSLSESDVQSLIAYIKTLK